MVTRFDCPNLWSLLIVFIMHKRMRRIVQRDAEGFLGVTMLVDWRRRTLHNVSLWRDVESVYSMGKIARHVDATRQPRRLGVSSQGAVYSCAGDWRRVLFGVAPD